MRQNYLKLIKVLAVLALVTLTCTAQPPNVLPPIDGIIAPQPYQTPYQIPSSDSAPTQTRPVTAGPPQSTPYASYNTVADSLPQYQSLTAEQVLAAAPGQSPGPYNPGSSTGSSTGPYYPSPSPGPSIGSSPGSSTGVCSPSPGSSIGSSPGFCSPNFCLQTMVINPANLQQWVLYNGVWSFGPAGINFGNGMSIVISNNVNQNIYSYERYWSSGLNIWKYFGYRFPSYVHCIFYADQPGWHELAFYGDRSGWSNVIWVYVY